VADSNDPFFIPNLCSIKSLMILAITAQLIAMILILATGDILSESWDEFGLLSLFILWIVFISAAVLCGVRGKLAKLPVVWSALIAYLLVVIITAIIAALAQYFLNHIHYQWGDRPETFGHFITRATSISAIMTFVTMRYFYVQQKWKQQIELESQARIEALQARIRPHFLFNSMNIIASLIQSHPKLAEQAVEDLSEIFRATLKDTGSMVPLKEEWRLCRNYLRIEGLRLGERLKVDADLSMAPEDAAIPMLTLQPLVENAIYHGIQSLTMGGTVKVRAIMENNQISITITNPVPKDSQPKPPQGNKIALANIKHRLNLLFGSHAKLILHASTDYYEVILTFPYMKSGTVI